MWLFEKLREFLGRRKPPAPELAHDRTGAAADLELQAATAVLLIEAAYGDTEYVWREHRAIVNGLDREFGLDRKQIEALLGRADEIRPPVVKLADVTEVLRERFDEAQRAEVVRLVWRVIEADRRVEEWEEAFADHIARALGITREAARPPRRA